MPPLRCLPPERLLGATRFALEDDLRGSLNTVKMVKQVWWAASSVQRAASDLEPAIGRRRKPGRWELAEVAFVASRQVDMQPWWDESTDELGGSAASRMGSLPTRR